MKAANDMKKQIIDIKAIESILGYRFKNKDLIIRALTHSSLDKNNYELLEFLGDSILNFILTEAIVERFGGLYNEGRLSKIKSYLVSRDTISSLCFKLGLNNHILMSYNESMNSGHHKNSMAEDVLEAVVAAIYLDSNIMEAKKLVLRLWQDSFKGATQMSDVFDPKTRLQEICHKIYQDLPSYSLIRSATDGHEHIFKVSCKIAKYTTIGTGKNKKEAEKQAATLMLKEIDKAC